MNDSNEFDARWARWLESAGEGAEVLGSDKDFLCDVEKVWHQSEYVFRTCERYPELLKQFHQSGDLNVSYPEGDMASRLQEALADVENEDELSAGLRRFRHQQMVRIIWRDLTRKAPLAEVLEDLSALADACVQAALDYHYARLVEQMGTPRDSEGNAQTMVVLGMGKLGARELNLSSDIDLIYAYPSTGQVDGPRGQTNEQFFIRLGQNLTKALNTQTVDGFVFRVDVRLRPFGDAGPLAMSFAAMETYYESQAREWERYAMIKARVVAGDSHAGEELMGMLRPFVYRRYLDFGAIESLREMKKLISQELKRKSMADNIKLGPGGIREIEFVGQAFQLIRGGRENELQIRPIMQVLELLAEKNYLPQYVVDELQEAYEFLRLVENRLQAWQDKQTHVLPEDESGRQRLAESMEFESWSEFLMVLDRHRLRVQGHFDKVFAAPQAETEEEPAPLAMVWQDGLSEEDSIARLAEAGFDEPEVALERLKGLRSCGPCRALGTRGREQLDQLMPMLLTAVGSTSNPQITLDRVARLIEAIARRTSYIALLVETPMALSQLVRLSSVSPMISDLLTRTPLLLDELLDPRRLYEPLHHDGLTAELSSMLGSLDFDDLEQQMDRLRQFVKSSQLRVAAADITEAISLMVVSDYLTEIAEVVLDQAVDIAWQQLTARHGRPGKLESDGSGFVVIGYGKLGGIELGYGSDLDLVFLHSNYPATASTDGEKSLANDVFYARLGQRIIHLFTTRTPAGILYEMDMRLRPNGASGMLVSSVHAFEKYQTEQAWTWEHQALVRARAVAGDPEAKKEFDSVRREILSRPREETSLKKDVREMRERMREQLAVSKPGLFDLKQGLGGIADIEFMVQYSVLRWASDFPELLQWTDNIRLLDELANSGRLEQNDASQLAEAYRVFRAAYHRSSLQDMPGLVDEADLQEHREAVRAIWQSLMEE